MKNAITRLTISLFVLGTTLPVFGAQLDVRAFIDGRSDLVIQGNNVWWQHLDGAAPGRGAGNNEPTYLNGLAWFPEDSPVYSQLSPTLDLDGSPISVAVISARGSVTIIQEEPLNYHFTGIVEFDDNPFEGAAWYEVSIFDYSGGPRPPEISFVPEDGPTFIHCATDPSPFVGGIFTVHVSDPDSDTLRVTAIPWQGIMPVPQTVTGTQGAGIDVTFNAGGVPDSVIEFIVSDGHNRVSQFTRLDVIEDPPPFIYCPADMSVQADPGQTSAIVNYPPPTVSFPLSDPSQVTCDPPSGSAFPIGTTTVLCTGIDVSPCHYPPVQCTFNVTVAALDPCANDSQAPQVSCLALKPSRLFPNPTRIVAQVQLLATDDCDSDPLIYVGGTKTAYVAGPFHNGDIVEVAHGPTLTPGSHPGGPPNVAAIQLIGDVQIWAVDSSGNASGKQSCIDVVANHPPTVAITSPPDGAVFTAPADVPVHVTAQDADGAVVQIQLTDGTTTFTSTATDFDYTFPSLAFGNYTLTATATDNIGVTASSSINVMVEYANPFGLTIDLTTVSTTYSYQGTETRDDLARVIAGSPVLCRESLDAATFFGGSSSECGFLDVMNHGYYLSVSFPVTSCQAGPWSFRLGPDLGRGGAVFVDGVKMASRTDDVWWGFNWNSSAVLHITDLVLAPGTHRLEAIGFEDCCAGGMSLEYQVGNAAWQEVSLANLNPADRDNDGIADCDDHCPSSNLSPTVVIGGCDSGVSNVLLAGGCTISDITADCAVTARNHDAFMNCLAEQLTRLVERGFITAAERNSVLSCAARAGLTRDEPGN